MKNEKKKKNILATSNYLTFIPTYLGTHHVPRYTSRRTNKKLKFPKPMIYTGSPLVVTPEPNRVFE